MKYIKTYENSQLEPQVGDYVAVKKPKMLAFPNPTAFDNLNKIFIGRIVGKKNNNYGVKYPKKFPNNIETWWIQRSEIIDFSKNKEDLKYIKQAQKYNL